MEQCNGNRKRIYIKWPDTGASAKDILKINCCVMVDVELLVTKGFQLFYQEWMLNIPYDKKRDLFVPIIGEKAKENLVECSGIRKLQYMGCNNYASIFRNIKSMGTWVFIIKDKKKLGMIIKAAKEAETYIQIYGLNQDGKLDNYRTNKKEKYKVQNKLSDIDKFSLSTKMETISRVVRKSQVAPQKGEIVYTQQGTPIVIGDEFCSNPQSITYQTDKKDLQVKIYQASWLNISYFEDKARKMVEKHIECEGICWPIALLYNAQGEFVGILVPSAEGYQLKQELMSQHGLERNFPEWNRKNLTHLTKVILEKIVYLQDRNILFGLINPSTIFVKDENTVYFTEMDTYQIEGYPILSHEQVFEAPELQDEKEKLRLYSKQEDNYGIALLVFMILLPGKFPYSKGKNRTISESIKNMDFVFNYGTHGEEHGAKELFGLWRFAWSHLGNNLKQAFYNTFQKGKLYSYPNARKDAGFWKEKVGELERELISPYDKESLKIFPCTFKRFSGTKTIKCIKCGIDHPIFYYKYPEKQICNSCLGKPSSTHFVCKSCGKSFYYDFATLFKYERLVETKDFHMPTHCPYCRSDKRKCVRCGKMVPAYRINEKGMCYDCSVQERERIVKVYPCRCGNNEIRLTQGEVDFYMKKFGRLPQRCKQCRDNKNKTIRW